MYTTVGAKKKFPLSRFKDFLKSVWKTFNTFLATFSLTFLAIFFFVPTFFSSDLSESDFFKVRGRTLLEHFSYCG